jgi:hypothetical protein
MKPEDWQTIWADEQIAHRYWPGMMPDEDGGEEEGGGSLVMRNGNWELGNEYLVLHLYLCLVSGIWYLVSGITRTKLRNEVMK